VSVARRLGVGWLSSEQEDIASPSVGCQCCVKVTETLCAKRRRVFRKKSVFQEAEKPSSQTTGSKRA
jgi:hypothetical protein